VTEWPLILVTNDDGVLSPGLQAAAEPVANLGELLIAAPADVDGTPEIAASVDKWHTFGTADWTAAMHFTRLLARQILDEGRPDWYPCSTSTCCRPPRRRRRLHKTIQSSQRYYVSSRPVQARRLDQQYQLMVDIAVDRDNLERLGYLRHRSRPGGLGDPADLADDRRHHLDATRSAVIAGPTR
jgi:Survival protein SurE